MANNVAICDLYLTRTRLSLTSTADTPSFLESILIDIEVYAIAHPPEQHN